MINTDKVISVVYLLLTLLIFNSIAGANESTAPTFRKIIVSEMTKEVNGHQYKILSSEGIKSTGIKLNGNTAGIKAINALLLKSYLVSIDEELSCVDTEKQGGVWELSHDQSIIAWNKDFIVAQDFSEGNCGYAHGFSESNYIVFNLTTGQREMIESWLIKDYQTEISEESELGKLLSKLYSKQRTSHADSVKEADQDRIKECIQYYQANHFNQYWPASSGMTFRVNTEYIDRDCIDDVTVPYDKLLHFLTEEGKKAMQAFR